MRCRRAPAGTLLALLALAVPAPLGAEEQKCSLEPKAERVLRAVVEQLRAAEQISFTAAVTEETVLPSGLKIQFAGEATCFARRPDRLRFRHSGDVRREEFWFDGATLTILKPAENVYASWPVRGTIDTLLDRLRSDVGYTPPTLRLLHEDLFEEALRNVRTGFHVGTGTVNGIPCSHLAFTQERVDWQLWVEEGGQPLVRKLVVTYKQQPGVPQYTAVFTRWDLAPRLTDSLFSFDCPEGAVKVDALPRLRR